MQLQSPSHISGSGPPSKDIPSLYKPSLLFLIDWALGLTRGCVAASPIWWTCQSTCRSVPWCATRSFPCLVTRSVSWCTPRSVPCVTRSVSWCSTLSVPCVTLSVSWCSTRSVPWCATRSVYSFITRSVHWHITRSGLLPRVASSPQSFILKIDALCDVLTLSLMERNRNFPDSGSRTLNQCTVQTFTESEDTRCCVNIIFPPEDGHVNARNMSRIIV